MRHGCSNKTPEKKSEINLQNESSPTHESEMKHNSSDDKNVDVVVTKYKRAAAFLWTVIHAQVRGSIREGDPYFVSKLACFVSSRQLIKYQKLTLNRVRLNLRYFIRSGLPATGTRMPCPRLLWYKTIISTHPIMYSQCRSCLSYFIWWLPAGTKVDWTL